MEEKVKELEQQLAAAARDLKHSEAEKSLLNSQVDLANERFEKMRKHCQELELNQKALKDQIQESQKKYTLQLESFEEALRDKELMNMELLDLKHTSSRLSVELESSRKNVEELQEQINERETFKAGFNNQELQIVSLQNDLSSLTIEKMTLQSTLIDLQTRLSLSEEMCSQLKSVCGQLETKLNTAEENFNRADSILTETLSSKEELEQKVELLQMANDDSTMANVAVRNGEQEGLVKKRIAAEVETKEQLREFERMLTSSEKKNQELQQKLSLSESKLLDAEKEIEELNEQVKYLNNMLEEVEEEATELLRNTENYEDKIDELESNLHKSFKRNTELERNLGELVEKVVEHEGVNTETQQRSLKLEELVRTSHSKADDAVKRVSELELLLEASNYRTFELEQLLSIAEAKVKDSEIELRLYNNKVGELTAELEAYKTKSTSLEAIMQDAKDKEMDLTEMLSVAKKERKKLQELSSTQGKNLSEAENLIQILQSELKSLRVNLESVEKDLEASRVREKVLLEKLRQAEEQLKHDGKAVEEVAAKNKALISQHEVTLKDSEKKLLRATTSFKQKATEANDLYVQLKYLGEQVAFYKEQLTENAEKVAALKAQLDASATRMAYVENNNSELKAKLSKANTDAERINSENEVLAGTNTKLRDELRTHQIKVVELNELLKSTSSDKSEVVELLHSSSHEEANLTEHSRGLDEQVAARLHEAIEKFEQRDSEAEELSKKLLELEAQLRTSEEQSKSSALDAAQVNNKLEDALVKIEGQKKLFEELQCKCDEFNNTNDGLIRENQNLAQELETSKVEMAELQVSFQAIVAERDIVSLQISSSRKEMDDLVKQLDFNKEILQSQIESLSAAVAEKDTLLTAKREEQTNAIQERDALHEQLKVIQNELALAHVTMIKQKDLESKKELERQASIKQSLGELASERQHATLLENQVDKLKQRLLEIERQYQKKVMESEKYATLNDELNEMKHNLRQSVKMERTIANLHNQLQLHTIQNEENNEMASSIESNKFLQTTEIMSVEPGTHFAVEPSGAMALKFLMGVAFLAVIFGIILGKRY